MLEWPVVKPSYSRPRVSDDSAYAESLFRTAKYGPEFPLKGFATLKAARQWGAEFVHWYDVEHEHSGIRYVPPQQRHAGEDHAVLGARHALYTTTKERHPGQRMAVDSSTAKAALRWLETLKLKSGEMELMTICAGAVLAALAGLLNRRRATTHHQHLEELQRVAPTCQVVSNRVFVEDAPVFSSAGVTTGVDLMLHRISQVCGAAVAAQVAQTMVVSMRRGPQDPELSPFLAYRNHLHPAVHRVQDAISLAPAQDWDLTAMSSVAHTSPRHLMRLFVAHASVAPLAYLQQIRLAVAQHALQSGRNVTHAAEMAGFSSDTQLRRAWSQFGPPGTPSQTGEKHIQETS